MTEDKQWKKTSRAESEERILKFWRENKIFEKTLNKKSNGEFVFYDGPPFATGLPHYGHILAGTMKDVIPRYQTMRGNHVRRQWGWDCHGLPIENLVEKELDLKTKKDIEDFGIDKFNKAAESSVLRYEHDWARIVPRTGRFVDMDKKYQTMDGTYTESIWWAFKNLYDKGLVYKGYKSMHMCPRCGTTLSNFEVNLGYQDIKDISVYVKFRITNYTKRAEKDSPLLNDKGVYLLAWTTTPWTLPGNAALAINPDILYSELEVGGEEGVFIVAKDRIEQVFKDKKNSVKRTVKGSDLVGVEYAPIFDYYKGDTSIPNIDKAWRVHSADFVTTEDGTGVVHIAPAFGEDDLNLAQANDIPVIQHVGMDGKMKSEVRDFAGLSVKPKDSEGVDHMSTDIEIIKYLAGKGVLFAKEKITHSYPHCWRCDTPLLNYASTSWFVKVTAMKDDLLKENEKISWVPEEIGKNRFGKWLEGARDWAISRTRYWGAPLPVWECRECKKREVMGSINELFSRVEKRNNIYGMRHGETDNNIKSCISAIADAPDHLNEKGKQQAKEGAEELKDKKVDLIFASPFVRTRETAEIVAKELGLDVGSIIFDERLVEIKAEKMQGQSWSTFDAYYKKPDDVINARFENTESWGEVLARSVAFFDDINKKYQGKNILVVTHGGVLNMMNLVMKSIDDPRALEKYFGGEYQRYKNGEVRDLGFKAFPHDERGLINFHRPHIDDVNISCACGSEMKRVPDVFDCWFESGSMPFAQYHYPFENTDVFNPKAGIGYPADFIAEALDQTRGWFYTLLVLGVGLFGKSPYKNVIVSGLVLAEDGKKMSKRLKNYPDVDYVLDTYGADAMRYYLISSPVVRTEDLRFSEKGVDEIMKKNIMRLLNVSSFLSMYGGSCFKEADKKYMTVLDKWMFARISEVFEDVSESLDRYELDKAARPFGLLIDDLSTWYLRRSRDRFKSEDSEEVVFVRTILTKMLRQISLMLAPFMPYVSEELYQQVKNENDPESVHLLSWEIPSMKDLDVLEKMKVTREIVMKGLESRARSNVRVRQPLQSITVRGDGMDGEYVELIKDELNVKEVLFDVKADLDLSLNTDLTPELIEEGIARECVRMIQDERKKVGLVYEDKAKATLKVGEIAAVAIKKHHEMIKKTCGLVEINIEASGEKDNSIAEVAVIKL